MLSELSKLSTLFLNNRGGKVSRIDVKELSRLFKLAKGYRNISQFSEDCGIIEEKWILIDIINERYNPSLRSHHLRKVAKASEFRVTLDQLAQAADINVDDSTSELKAINVIRGCIYWYEYTNVIDNEQGGKRPVVILQNQLGNERSTLSIIAPISTATYKSNLPLHVKIGEESGLWKESEIMLEHINTVSKRRFLFDGEPEYIGKVPDYIMRQIDSAIKKSLGIISVFYNEQVVRDYLCALESIKHAKLTKYNAGLEMAENILMKKFDDYCLDYGRNSNDIIADFFNPSLSYAI